MVILEPIKPRLHGETPRLWLVFFGHGEGAAWWSRFMRPGFRHVAAAAWYERERVWVYYNPARRGTVIEVYPEDEFDGRFGQLLLTSAAVLRVRSRFERNAAPAAWHCVGAIKALLGIRACALVPWHLYRHLLATGAEKVEIATNGQPVRFTGAAAGGPCDCAPASA